MANLESAQGAVAVSFNFDYMGRQPNFARDQFATKAEMNAYTICSPGKIAVCTEGGELEYYRFNSGVWEKLNIDLAGTQAASAALVQSLEERLINLESSYSNFTAKEVKVVDELPDASEETMNILYMVPNAGGTALENYVTTKSFDSDTYPNALIDTLMGDTAWTYENIYPEIKDDADSSPDDTQSLETQLTDIFESDSSKCIFLVTYGEGVDAETAKVANLVHAYRNENNAVVFEYYTNDAEGIANGSTVIVKNSEGTYIAMTVSDVETSGVVNKDWLSNSSLSLYTYDWYQAGTTDYDDSNKQDALYLQSNYVLGKINGTPYIFPNAIAVPSSSSITTPSASASITSSNPQSVELGTTYKFSVLNNQSNGVTYYKKSSSSVTDVTSSDYTGYTTGTVTDYMSITSASQTVYLAAATYLYGVKSEVITREYTIIGKLVKPTVSIVSGTDNFSSSRSVTIKNSSNNPSVTLHYTLQYSDEASATEYTVALSSGGSTTLTLTKDSATGCSIVAWCTKTDYTTSNTSALSVTINCPKMYYGMCYAEPDSTFMDTIAQILSDIENYPAITVDSDRNYDYVNSLNEVFGTSYIDQNNKGVQLDYKAVRTLSFDTSTSTTTELDPEDTKEYRFLCIPKTVGSYTTANLIEVSESGFTTTGNWTMIDSDDSTYLIIYTTSPVEDTNNEMKVKFIAAV